MVLLKCTSEVIQIYSSPNVHFRSSFPPSVNHKYFCSFSMFYSKSTAAHSEIFVPFSFYDCECNSVLEIFFDNWHSSPIDFHALASFWSRHQWFTQGPSALTLSDRSRGLPSYLPVPFPSLLGLHVQKTRDGTRCGVLAW